MTCTVILTPQNARFLAHVAELPNCRAEAESRDQALAMIRECLGEIAQRSEFLKLEIPTSEKRNEHAQQPPPKAVKPPKLVQFSPMVLATDKTVHLKTPWECFGIFKDDPTWMPMLEDIERRRDRQKVPKLKKGKRRKK